MVSLGTVLENNSNITRRYGSGLVGVFVGGTSGIGESTARAFLRNTDASHAYIIGRDEARASAIIDEVRQIKQDPRITFIKSDVSLLREIDDACSAIQQKEDKVNILFLSPGVGTMNGRTETDEGLDVKLGLHYYSRMRFVTNLLPQLIMAGNADPNTENRDIQPLSRVISVLEAGGEAALRLDDLSLKTHYSLRNCAKHAITMNSISMEYLASQHPQISFIHSFPGVVRTRLDRHFGTVTKYAFSALLLLFRTWEIPFNESGERHLYAATSPLFPPQKYKDSTLDAAEGSEGYKGSGSYRINQHGSAYSSSKIMQIYREDGTRKMIWKHTLDIFAKVLGA